MKKRILSTLLALCMVLTLLPGTAWAADSDFTIKDGVLTKYVGVGGDVTIPEGITSIGRNAFSGCEDLTSVTVSEGVTSIGIEAFSDCKGLINVAIPSSVTNIDFSAFMGCSSLIAIQVNSGNLKYTSEDGVLLTKARDTLVHYPAGKLGDYVIPNSVTSIGAWAFRDCSNLTSVTIPSGVTHIEGTAFYNCSSLTNITIPSSVTDIGGWAFGGCISLTSIDIPNSVTSIKEHTFEGCTNLISVTIPSSITSIESYAFYNCSRLAGVRIPGSVTSIGWHAFEECSGLGYLVIGEGVTRIGNGAFYDCRNLSSVVIPMSITHIGDNAFEWCIGVANVYYSGTEEQWNKISIASGNTDIKYVPIHYNSTGPGNPNNGDLEWGKENPQQTLEVGKTLTLTVQMSDGSAVDANKLTWTINPALGTAEIVDQGQQDDKTAYVTLKGISPGKVTLHGTLAIGESILDYPAVSQEITVVGQKNISFVEDSYSAIIGDTLGINLRVPDPNGLAKDDVTFISNNDSVARVVGIADFFDLGELGFSYTVNIKCLKEGNTTITANALDGRNADCKVIVKESNPVVDSKIVVFSTEKSLTVKTGGTMNLVFGKVVNDHPVENWDHMAVVVSDPTVISLSEYETDEYGYAHTTVTGKKQGATYVTISDTETKENIIILITVRDAFVSSYSYAIDNMPSFYPDNIWENGIQTNIYNLNGLFVNSYTCVKNGRFYDVTFDVYNYMFTAGAIDIYDADGNWIDCEKISKFETPSGIWDILEGDYSIITDFMTYEMAAASKHSSISFKVPDGGYFTISNNFAESPGVFLFNTCDIVFNASLLKAAGDVDKGDIQLSVFSDLVKNQIKEDPTVRKAFMEMFKGTAKSEIRAIAKNMVKNQKEVAYSDLSNLFENLLDSVDISWKHLFQTATGMGESLFEKLAGPAGVALKGCFALSSGTSQAMQAIQIAASVDEPYATVYSSIKEGYIAQNGVIVNTNGNVDAETQLNVFRISNDDTIDFILNGDGSEELKKYELYNICFVKNNQLVQPNGNVTVRIPIPNGINGNTCTVYRQEKDGTWTILEAHIEDNYLVFETDHFSLYVVAGIQNELSISSIPHKTEYIVGETLDTTGLTLNMGGVLISNGFICEPTVLSEVGSQRIFVQYGHTSTTFDVIVKNDVVPSEHTHSWSTVWTSDASGHWHNCIVSDCPITTNSKKDGYGAHTSDGGKVTTAATAYQDGVRTFACAVCGYVIRTEKIPATGGNSSSSSSGDNSSSDPTYSVSVPSHVTGGKVTVRPASASAGNRVTITAKPNSGYDVGEVTVTDKDGKEVTVADAGDGKYTFIMPKSKIDVKVEFIRQQTTPADSIFIDIQPGAYYADAVAWAVEKGITVGTSATTFSPNASCTRAQIVTFLWRAAGSPKVNVDIPFIDVQPGAYYYDALLWAVEQGITSGTSATTFSPDTICTRAQAVTFLYRYEKSPVISGSDAFTDIGADAYYADAVQWAVSKGVTAGTSATFFSPNETCTRAQIVTFLYRGMA